MNEGLIKIVLSNILNAIPQDKRDKLVSDAQQAVEIIKTIDARLLAIEAKLTPSIESPCHEKGERRDLDTRPSIEFSNIVNTAD